MLKIVKLIIMISYSTVAMAYQPSLSVEDLNNLKLGPTQKIPFYHALVGLKIYISNDEVRTCSAVAILPNLILTAAHCLVTDSNFKLTYKMSQVRMYLPYYDSINKIGKKYDKFNDIDATIIVAPNFSAGSNKNINILAKDDLALIRIMTKNRYIEKKYTILGINDQFNNPYVIIPGVFATSLTNYSSQYKYATNYAIGDGSTNLKESDSFKILDKIYALGWGSNYDTGKTRYSPTNPDIYDAASIVCQGTAENIYAPAPNSSPIKKEYIINVNNKTSMRAKDHICQYQKALTSEKGDSGGPLFLVKSETNYVYLIGITSMTTIMNQNSNEIFTPLINNNSSWEYIKIMIDSALTEFKN